MMCLFKRRGGNSSINTELAKLQSTLLGYITELKESDELNTTIMLGKLDLLFTYIMKQGKILTSIKDSDLTDEMKTAINNYKEDNFKDYLGDFIKRHYKKVEWNEKKILKDERKKSRTDCDAFLTHYKQYLILRK